MTERPDKLNCDKYYGVYVFYKRVKQILGFFFFWVLVLILTTGGKINIQIGLIDWILKQISQIK